jgi:hypothetical protein
MTDTWPSVLAPRSLYPAGVHQSEFLGLLNLELMLVFNL